MLISWSRRVWGWGRWWRRGISYLLVLRLLPLSSFLNTSVNHLLEKKVKLKHKRHYWQARKNNIYTHIYLIQAMEMMMDLFCNRKGFVRRYYPAVASIQCSQWKPSTSGEVRWEGLACTSLKGPKANMWRKISKSPLQFWKTDKQKT